MVFRAGKVLAEAVAFFFSHDNRFIIKTMTDGEMKLFLNKMQPSYEHHFQEKSLIAKILGVFTVRSV